MSRVPRVPLPRRFRTNVNFNANFSKRKLRHLHGSFLPDIQTSLRNTTNTIQNGISHDNFNHKLRKTANELPSQRNHKLRKTMNNFPRHDYGNKSTMQTATHNSNRRFRQVLVLLSVPAALAFQKRNLQLQLRKLAYQLPLPTNSSNSRNRDKRNNRSNSSNRSSNSSTIRDTY